VEITGLGGSGFSHNACAPPGGPDMGHLGVEDLTSLSVVIAEGSSYDLTVAFGSCDGSTFAAVGSVWVDWNSDLVVSSGEVSGTVIGNPSTGVFAVSPPPGTALGPKTMRVTWQEGGVLPLDPCALFDWGSVMDFTVNVVAPPDC